jgi:septum formation protein
MESDFVLASSSPRRLALLAQAGIYPKKVEKPDVLEEKSKDETVLAYVRRMAREKALCVAERCPGDNVLAADTVVVCGNKVLAKTDDEKQARDNLFLLSGRRHKVITAVCLIDRNGKEIIKHSVSKVKFKRLSPEDIRSYLASGEWKDKAGSYAIQGRAECFVQMISGSWSNIVGLPLYDTMNIINQIKRMA